MRLEIGLFILLGIFCQLIGTMILAFLSPSSDRMPLTIAVLISLATSIPPIVARHSAFARNNPAAMPMATVGWRMGVLLFTVALSAATKWPSHKLFCATLLGCYFPFLILESALSIRRIKLDTRSRS